MKLKSSKFLVVLALIALLASHVELMVVHAQESRVAVFEATVGADGWALIQIPYGARVLRIEYTVSSGWAGAAARPLLYATLPDPLLWEKLAKLTIVAPASASKPSPRVIEATGFTIVAVPGAPGSRVRVEALLGEAGSSTEGLMVIVVPDGSVFAKEYAEKIAALHPGLEVRVYTLSQVKELFPAAPEPGDICRPGKGDAPDYDLEAALHIIGMERELLDEGLRYLLLIGRAGDVPPIYYCSPILRELVSPKEGMVPSDYYYSDPDYDGVAEVAVGRLPFTDPVSLAGYYSALKKWIEGGEWQGYALVSGGAPFNSILFVGEAAASQAAHILSSMNVSVDAFMLSRGNYVGFRLNGYLGRYGIYYIMAHGSGSSLLDYVPGGLWNYDFQELLYAGDVTGLGMPGLYILPACRDGFWDTDLVEPPFKPPSLGVALLSKGAAVGYVGFARVAVEVIDGVALTSGRLVLSMAGADRLLIEFVKALGSSDTIGTAFANALTAYNALPAAKYRAYLAQGEEEIGTLVTRTAVLLGDPAAPAPWRSNGGYTSTAAGLTPVGGYLGVGAALLAPKLARYTSGTMPAVNPGSSGVVMVDLPGPCPGEVHAYALQRVVGTTMIGMVEINVSESVVGDKCRLAISVPPSAPGLIRILVVTDQGPEAYYLAAAGAYLDKEHRELVLRGLDLLGVVGDEPILLRLNNATVMTLEGGKPAAHIPLDTLQAAGRVVVSLAPLYDTPSIYGGSLVAREAAKIAKLFTLNMTLPAPSLLAPGLSFSKPALGGVQEEEPPGGTGTTALLAGLGGAAAATILYRRRAASRCSEAPSYLI